MRSKVTLRKQRSKHVIAALIVLGLPACAVALTGVTTLARAAGPQASSPPRLRFNPRQTKSGQPVTVTGLVASSDAGREIRLEIAPTRRASWQPLAVTRVGPTGGFRFRVALYRSGFVRVIGATGDAAGTSTPAASPIPASAPYPVAVGVQIRVAARALNELGGSVFAVHGRLLPALSGRAVRLQGHFGTGWRTLAAGRTGPAGGFRLRVSAVSGMERRLRVLFTGDRFNAESAQPAGRLTVYDTSVASWYDDAGSTACGFHAGLGVANRTLPCGTKVGFRYGGRSVTAVVDDRGPYVGGRDWDLNQNTAAALGFGGVGTVWSTQ